MGFFIPSSLTDLLHFGIIIYKEHVLKIIKRWEENDDDYINNINMMCLDVGNEKDFHISEIFAHHKINCKNALPFKWTAELFGT